MYPSLKLVLAVLLGLSLAGCSMTLPVRGSVTGTNEPITGTATGYSGGSGTLAVSLGSTATCSGNFVYVTPREGEGVFNCSDGRSGPFHFVSTGSNGTGTGDFNGQRFIFTFG